MPERGAVKSLWRIAVPVICVALICGAAVSWHFAKTRTIERRLVEDAKACRLRAEQGDANAQYDLARLYYQGKGVPQDYAEAARWYRKAADQGNAKAQYGVGFMYDSGKGVPQDYSEAVGWYRKAADQGNAKAQYGLALMYHEGKGVPRDYAKAVDWCRKAADQGYAKAQYALGYTYFEGKEVPQDHSEAVRWYRKAADQGYAEAQSDLGYMYSQGEGVPQDYNEAVGWYRKAADQGHASAQSALGYAYSEGKGVPRDYAQSARWYRKAAKQGDDYARCALGAMKIRLTAGGKIVLSVAFLGSVLFLISSRGNIRNREQRRVTLAGVLVMLWVGLDVWGHYYFSILLTLSAVNVFFFGKGLLCGIGVVMLLSTVQPLRRAKSALIICGTLFIGFNVYATTHYDLRHFAACPRAFYSVNALLIGMAATLAILLWFAREETKESQNGNDGIAPGTVARNGTEPLRM
jgi:TPR repeat protein